MMTKIALSDSAPVEIETGDWPTIAYADDHSGEHACQASEIWWIRVRQHADGRRLVYAVRERGPGGAPIAYRGRYAGWLLPAGAPEDATIAAIRRLGCVIGDAIVADAAIADLPAVALDAPGTPRDAAREVQRCVLALHMAVTELRRVLAREQSELALEPDLDPAAVTMKLGPLSLNVGHIVEGAAQ